MPRLYQMIVVCLLTSPASVVWSAPATTTWTTYLYQGPGSHYAVVDELPQATSLSDAQCSAEWCKVKLGSRIGYVKSEVVAFGDPARPVAGLLPQPAASLKLDRPTGSCIEANQTGGNGGNAMTIFCGR